MAYVYTPVVIDSETGHFDPAKDDNGNLVSALADLIGGIAVLKSDVTVPRHVLNCPEEQPTLTGWETRTASEVNTDYPGLVPEGE